MNLPSPKLLIYNRLLILTHLFVSIFFYVPQNINCYCFFRKSEFILLSGYKEHLPSVLLLLLQFMLCCSAISWHKVCLSMDPHEVSLHIFCSTCGWWPHWVKEILLWKKATCQNLWLIYLRLLLCENTIDLALTVVSGYVIAVSLGQYSGHSMAVFSSQMGGHDTTTWVAGVELWDNFTVQLAHSCFWVSTRAL